MRIVVNGEERAVTVPALVRRAVAALADPI